MNLDKIWVNDPKTKEPSVSLSLVVLFVLFATISSICEMFELTKTTSLAFEMLGASFGLYFGRKYTTNKGSVLEKE